MGRLFEITCNAGLAVARLGMAIAAWSLLATPAVAAPAPAAPVSWEFLAEIKEQAWAWGSEADPALDGNRLYIPLGGGGLAVYDVADPSNPERLFHGDDSYFGSQPGAIAVRGNVGYLALPPDGQIVELDFSDPSNPRLGARFANIELIEQLSLVGNRLYVVESSNGSAPGGVSVFDTTVTPPALLGAYYVDLLDPGFFVTENHQVLLARTPATGDDTPGIQVVDMATPSSPQVVGNWTSKRPGNITDMAVAGTQLMCSAYWGGLWVLDATDLANMKALDYYDLDAVEAHADAVAVWSPYVILARSAPSSSNRQFEVVRIDAGKVEYEDRIAAERWPTSVHVAGDLAVLGDSADVDGDGWFDEKHLRLYRVSGGVSGPVPGLGAAGALVLVGGLATVLLRGSRRRAVSLAPAARGAGHGW
ncbi:MAG: hypothetical protein HYV63_26770 [Candidatus Schekmanbacteria bacterium]|nr:hypothetical protein [Candidatus Schekmanbacteria bacterium]